MREVSVVKEQRNQLKEELKRFEDLKAKLYAPPFRWSDLDLDDKRKHGYITHTITKLQIQINALEFALNEDTELNDETRTVTVLHKFKKEDLFKTKESKGCNCRYCRDEVEDDSIRGFSRGRC